jgi:hypothetical protein
MQYGQMKGNQYNNNRQQRQQHSAGNQGGYQKGGDGMYGNKSQY